MEEINKGNYNTKDKREMEFEMKDKEFQDELNTTLPLSQSNLVLFNEQEFISLIGIQKKYCDKILSEEWKRFEIFLSILGTHYQGKVRIIADRLINNTNEKVRNWIAGKKWEMGVIRVKDIFCLSHHIALLPVIYKHFADVTPLDIESQYTEESINTFLLNTYPLLKKTLENISENYIAMRNEYKECQLDKKLGYGDIPTKHFSIFRLSIIRQLRANFNRLEREGKMSELTEKVVNLKAKGLSQRQIATIIGKTQPYVSFLLSKTPSKSP